MLDDDAIARYARQIVVPGIGAAGQRKLMGATVLVVGAARGVAQARLYLEAAGVHTVQDPACNADVVVVAGVSDAAPDLLDALASADRPVCWYTVEDEGFTAGVHPAAPLPRPRPGPTEATAAAQHDAAACDAAAVACAILIGLAYRHGPLRFDAGTRDER